MPTDIVVKCCCLLLSFPLVAVLLIEITKSDTGCYHFLQTERVIITRASYQCLLPRWKTHVIFIFHFVR